MKTKRRPITGYRTMTGAQRHNARMERIWDSFKEGDETHYPGCSQIDVG